MIDNFSIDYAKKKKTKIGGKLLEVRVQKDLFGRKLGISIDYKVDMAKFFTYPITPVPLSLCHFDGGIYYERSLRHESTQLGFNITGPDQVRPSDFAKELKNIWFKQALVDCFILHWSTEEMVPFMNNKIIVVNFKKCHSFTVTNNIVVSNIDETLTCTDHEEADTKIIHHICNIDVQANFVIRCSDTDIAAIMLGNMRHLKNEDSHVWILTDIGNR
ncbi:hypothetical protein TNCV_5127161 [Trichonephila clavipes]|nr:hypothetical protein TNCV_5127161 [Trichonephila clavipes]